ncbi:hypothetical protein [Streptomyces sp. ISL-94]|uniref:hypothetical protein n=1 Tax=Streptomyces sp. ISL-94 TaxID=2819190 RepID=UPI001BEAFDC9|nr:hypothetical protein [Streptomyces sp. ISL-94]MBT2477655.1 hypothetical protein [Streptomyces sp. ISL-94]
MSALELDWYGCDLRTGAIAEELPQLTASQLSRRLGAVTSSSFALDLSEAPTEWEAATDPGRTMLVAVDRQTVTPLWAGLSLTRSGGSGTQVELAACSPEGYLDRRYPGTYTATQVDASTVMADLAAPIASTGLPITFDTTASGLLIDYESVDTDDKTILSSLQTISAMAGAPEWTIDVVWADAAETAFALVLRIRPTIGTVDTAPEAVFDLPGCISDYHLSESYEQGKGATVVVASGEGEGNARIQSDVQTADGLIAAGWIRWIHRYTPGTGIISVGQLNAHAQATLQLLQTGSRAWTVDAVASEAPRLGSDWNLGNSVSIQITRSPRHPAGASVVARAYGWDLDVAGNKVSPILLEG